MRHYTKRQITTNLTKEMLFYSLDNEELLTLTAGHVVYKGVVETIGYANTKSTAFNFRLLGKETDGAQFFGLRGYADITNPEKSWLETPDIR